MCVCVFEKGIYLNLGSEAVRVDVPVELAATDTPLPPLWLDVVLVVVLAAEREVILDLMESNHCKANSCPNKHTTCETITREPQQQKEHNNSDTVSQSVSQ